MTTRPSVQVTRYIWLTPGRHGLRGIALRRGNQLMAHYTADEARRFADQLHDLADQLDQENQQ